MTETVEILAGVDPVYVADRHVRYWIEFKGIKSPSLTDWSTVEAEAWALVKEHDACLVDRSDRGSGFLLSTLLHS